MASGCGCKEVYRFPHTINLDFSLSKYFRGCRKPRK